MRNSRFSESQKFAILKELESGVKVSELCRKHGVAQNTIYKWRSKYGGMELSDMRKLKELEDENRKLKQMYANLSLENHVLKDLIEKNF